MRLAPRWKIPLVLVAILLFPAGLAPGHPRWDDAPPTYAGSVEESGAGEWRTWFVKDVASVLPERPPSAEETLAELHELRELSRERTSRSLAEAHRWDEGPANIPWVDIHMEALGKHTAAPPASARNLAILDLTIHDAIIATWYAKEHYDRAGPGLFDADLPAFAPRSNPSYPSEHAAVAGAASRVLGWLYPHDAEYYEELAEEAAYSRLVAGVNFRSDVEAGLELGRAVADIVIQARMMDGSIEGDELFPIEKIPRGPNAPYGACSWKPTPTLKAGPWGVAWGNVTPFLLSNDDINDVLAPPPPECESPEYFADHRAVYEHSVKDPQHLKDWAVWWHDHGWKHPEGHIETDSLSVSGIFAPFLRDWIMLDELSTPRSARAFGLMHGSMADTFISIWRSKYIWWSERPVTVFHNKTGPVDWLPTIETPNFPGYPSGHSGQGGSSATILGHLFPERVNIAQGWGYDEAWSREIVGVHPKFDDDEGHAQGVRVAQYYLEWARTDGADDPAPPPRS